MATITLKRAQKIITEQEQINKDVARSISSLNRDILRVVNFIAWANDSLLKADGDITAEDMAIIAGEYHALAPLVRALVPILDDIEGIDGIQANLDTFVTKYGLDIADYKTRFDS